MFKKNYVWICVLLIIVLVVAIGFVVFDSVKNKQGNVDGTDAMTSTNEIDNQQNKNNTNQKKTEVAEGTTIKIKDIECEKGEEITIEIKLQKDTSFVAANFEYDYDRENLDYMGFAAGKSFEEAAMFMVNDDDGIIKMGYVASPDDEKLVKAGDMVYLKFKVKDTVTKTDIENMFSVTILKTEDGTDIPATISQGSIKIK